MNKYLFALTAVFLLACGVSTQLPVAPASVSMAQPVNTIHATATEYPRSDNYVTALDKVTIRECPDTDNLKCPPVGYLERGTWVLVMGEARLTPDNIRCGSWLPIAWQGETRWICQEWTSK